MRSVLFTAGTCAVLALCACASRPTTTESPESPDPVASPDLPPAGSDGEYQAGLPPPAGPEAREIQLNLGEPLDGCGLQHAYFSFDASKPLPQSHVEMEMVAECLKHSPFDDRGILLIGHTDASGSDAYNKKLSEERAEAVKDLLVERGVDGSRIETIARSEAESKGHQPEYSEGHDRRVDVVELTVMAPR